MHMPLTAHEDCLLIVVDAQPGFYPEDLPDRPAALEARGRAPWVGGRAAVGWGGSRRWRACAGRSTPPWPVGAGWR